MIVCTRCGKIDPLPQEDCWLGKEIVGAGTEPHVLKTPLHLMTQTRTALRVHAPLLRTVWHDDRLKQRLRGMHGRS